MISQYDLNMMRQLAQERYTAHADFCEKADTAERYFKKNNDIKDESLEIKIKDKTGWREADNRVASNFFYIQLVQKASYGGAIPMTIDVGDERMNQIIANTLGEKLSDIQQRTIINAGLCWRTAILPWIDEFGQFQYTNIDGRKFIPVFNDALKRQLRFVMYFYNHTDEQGKKWEIMEIWDDYYVTSFRREADTDTFDNLIEYPAPSFSSHSESTHTPELPDLPENVRAHDFPGMNPWCLITNNQAGTNDLNAIKDEIDVYDKVYSCFADDLDDIQQASFIIKGYDGESLTEFKNNLKYYKAIKIDVDENAQGGVDMLTVEIPVEARKTFLEMTRKRIFEDGQGIDPDPENFGNSSGTALKHLYDNLELKTSNFRAGAKEGFEKLVRLICLKHGHTPKYIHITWNTNRQNDREEVANIIKNLSGIVSEHTLLSLLDFVSDPDAEMEQIAKEKLENMERFTAGLYPEDNLVEVEDAETDDNTAG